MRPDHLCGDGLVQEDLVKTASALLITSEVFAHNVLRTVTWRESSSTTPTHYHNSSSSSSESTWSHLRVFSDDIGEHNTLSLLGHVCHHNVIYLKPTNW